MGNIVELPDSMQRQWRTFEDSLKKWLLSEGCSQDEILQACEKLKPLYLQFAKPQTFSGDPETALASLNEWVKEQTMGFLTTIAVRDIELFRLRGEHHE